MEWIAVDWGTTHLRAWVMGAEDQMLKFLVCSKGMAELNSDQFEAALLDLVEPYLPAGRSTPIICCGMVGSREGWAEGGYVAAPCAPPDASQAVRVVTQEKRIDVRIIPGIKQSAPADIMRGEETQIAGYLWHKPKFAGLICLPGTHSKWVRIRAGEVMRFRTYMTGEIYALLSKHSVLRHSIDTRLWDDSSFLTAVTEAYAAPQDLTHKLFSVRAETLVVDLEPSAAAARLSGLLLGAELSSVRELRRKVKIVLIGESALCHIYQAALDTVGRQAEIATGPDLALAGLTAAYRSLKEAAA